MKDRLPYEMTSKAIKGYSESAIAKSETNDCVVRAFASSFEISYNDAHKYVAEEFKRQPRKGTYGTSLRLVKMSNENVEVNGKKVHLVGYRFTPSMFGTLSYDVKVKGEIKKRNMTVGTFIKRKRPVVRCATSIAFRLRLLLTPNHHAYCSDFLSFLNSFDFGAQFEWAARNGLQSRLISLKVALENSFTI